MDKKQVIQHFGGVTKLARALGLHRQTIYKWGDSVPEGRQYQIEVLTEGALKAERRLHSVTD